MKILDYKPTQHSYYCSDTNYHCSSNQAVYETWYDFRKDWSNIDIDYNYIFRFDLYPDNAGHEKEIYDYLVMHLYFILQRKGKFVPIIIKKIQEEDMKDITKYLKEHSEYSNHLWKEFRG